MRYYYIYTAVVPLEAYIYSWVRYKKSIIFHWDQLVIIEHKNQLLCESKKRKIRKYDSVKMICKNENLSPYTNIATQTCFCYPLLGHTWVILHMIGPPWFARSRMSVCPYPL